ncbi:HAD family hydrolase [Anaerolineae bacterium CFX9]|nr:HAD family hydrolase [Anaerolineae bacterium CFX9]
MTTPDNAIRGLTDAEAAARRQQGQGNNVEISTSRSYAQILRANVLNFINVILFTIGVVLIALGRVGDAVLSVGLILMNVVIGIYQEIRAKRQLDQIALLARPRVTVLRDGEERAVDPSEVVLGDILVARSGDQIVVDGVVVGGGRIEVDESLLTGESDLIPKRGGDEVMSGSFVVSGTAMIEARRVGAESFANKLTASARQFRVVQTPLQREVNFILRLLALLALIIGFLLFVSALVTAIPLVRGVQMASVVAGLVPNGLFFMVIVAYAMGALRIASQGALIQQSNSVESLSNVTVLCMDKTGTLTANRIHYETIIPQTGFTEEQAARLLGDFAHSVTATNKTSEAIAAGLSGTRRTVIDEVPFSSALKWSAIAVHDAEMPGVYALGALEMMADSLHPDSVEPLRATAAEYSEKGLRVLIFAGRTDTHILHDEAQQPALPPSLTPIALVILSDELRANVRETISGFRQAGVILKVISGDNPHTVAALAKQAGFEGDLKVVSGTELDGLDDAAFEAIAVEATIFGRITPQQKERLVDALRRRNYYVAMMGDGVNDVLSLKKANLGIAMESGSAATRGVADMILLGDSFAALPPAFLEGQRIVNGMQDILRLFLTRALTVALLIVATAVVGIGFPFVPKHVALLTFMAVGLPTLALATWARPDKIRGRLLASVVHFVVPAALMTFFFGFLIYIGFLMIYIDNANVPAEVTAETMAQFAETAVIEVTDPAAFAFEDAAVFARTALTIFTSLCGLMLVIFVEPPHPFFVAGDQLSPDKRPTYLVLAMLVGLILIIAIPPARHFFELVPLRAVDYLILTAAFIVWALMLRMAWRQRWLQRFLGIETNDAVQEYMRALEEKARQGKRSAA